MQVLNEGSTGKDFHIYKGGWSLCLLRKGSALAGRREQARVEKQRRTGLSLGSAAPGEPPARKWQGNTLVGAEEAREVEHV